jgi:hypothetical protein
MLKYLLLSLLVPITALGKTQTYRGEASTQGKVVYQELHQVEWKDGVPQSSVTQYLKPDGTLIAVLKNDYTQSLNAPEHEMNDIRHKNVHGMRYGKGQKELYSKEGSREKSKVVKESDGQGKIIVGGQGLHYYLVSNLEAVIEKKKLSLLFLIPGNLDAYNFYLKVMQADDKTVKMEIEIDNWFLKLFAPKLLLEYDRPTKKLLKYKGLSNLKDESNKMMNVEITYSYPEAE